MLIRRTTISLLVGVAIAATVGCARTSAPNLASDAGTAGQIRTALEAGVDSKASPSAAALAEPTGWATLMGRFQINGTPPQLSPLKVDKDTEICAPGGTQVMEETVEVSASGGIKNVLIYLVTEIPTDDPKWEHPSYLEAKAGEVTFDQKACIFLSHVVGMRSTQTLRILNSDPVLHNTNIQAGRGATPFNGSVSGNGETTYQPGGQTDRPFPISCGVHPWMSAYMITRDSPYFAVTDADGQFQIANVPAGVELQFRVWQEKVGDVKQVSLNGVSTPWGKGRFSVTLTPDEQRELDVAVNASEFN